MKAKQLVQELQAAIAANGGRDLWVGMRRYDEPPEYGTCEAVSVYTDEQPDEIVLTYN